MTPAELDRLVVLAQQGNKAAFTDLYLAVRKDIRIVLSAHATSLDMVEEALQATFVACFESLKTYQPRGTFVPWLRGIARNMLQRELRNRSRYAAAEGDVLEGILARSALASLSKGDEGEELNRKIHDCLSKLPSHSQELIEKRYVEKLPIDRMAQLLNRTESWVAVTLHRIRAALHGCLTKAEPSA